MRVAGLLAAALTITAGLGGCGLDVPLVSDDASTTSAPTTKDPGRPLAEDEAEMVLPIPAELPDGFHPVQNEPVGDDAQQSTYPVQCLDLSLLGETAKDLSESRVADARRHWQVSPGGDYAGYVAVIVQSHSVPVPDALFDDAGAAYGTCQAYQLTQGDGAVDYTAELLSTPSLGDRSYGVILRQTSPEGTTPEDDESWSLYIYAVKKGHTLVRLVYSFNDEMATVEQLSERVMQTTLDNLEEV